MSDKEKSRKHHPLGDKGRRVDAYSYWPHELTLVTDPKDPLFHQRVFEKIDDADVLDAATRGIVQNVVVKLRTDGSIPIIAGRQRTKRALVVNDLLGVHAYDGDIPAVREAILRMKKNGLDKRVLELAVRMKTGLRLAATPRNRSSDGEAYALSMSENTFRHNDGVREVAAHVQRMAELNVPIAEIALAVNKGEATIKRYLKLDTSIERVRKKRGKAARPSKTQIAAIAEQVAAYVTPRERAIFEWILGKSKGVDLAEEFLGTAQKRAATR